MLSNIEEVFKKTKEKKRIFGKKIIVKKRMKR